MGLAMRIRAIITAMLVGLCASGAQAAALEILVPAYFYPTMGPDWGWMTTAAARVPITAILNPASGPGQFADPNYVTVVNNFRAVGGRILGYVTSSYAARDLAAVQAEVETYAASYAIDGIFVDEMANDSAPAHLAWYTGLYGYIKSHHPAYRVIGNPGTTTQEVYLSTPTVDALVTYENYQNYRGYVPDAWVRNYPAHQFAHLPYLVATADSMRADIDLAVQRNAGLVFATDANLPNPYDRLPAYWEAEVTYVQAVRAVDVTELPDAGAGQLQLLVSPNPFREACAITLHAAGPEVADLWLADARGRVVSHLGGQAAAGHPILWRPATQPGQPVAHGIYFVVARSGAATVSRKLIYLR
jgi:hypothetical protein